MSGIPNERERMVKRRTERYCEFFCTPNLFEQLDYPGLGFDIPYELSVCERVPEDKSAAALPYLSKGLLTQSRDRHYGDTKSVEITVDRHHRCSLDMPR